MHCPKCGKEAAAEVKFCRACGMKLDLVARAVSEHFDPEQALEPVEPKESGSDRRILRNFAYLIFTGFFMVFIGAVMAVLGKQISPSVKMAGAILALLGMFVAIFGAMYPIFQAFRPASPKKEPKKEIEESSAGELPSGDDFESVRPVSSVTEGTTRELDKNKTKVLRSE